MRNKLQTHTWFLRSKAVQTEESSLKFNGDKSRNHHRENSKIARSSCKTIDSRASHRNDININNIDLIQAEDDAEFEYNNSDKNILLTRHKIRKYTNGDIEDSQIQTHRNADNTMFPKLK